MKTALFASAAALLFCSTVARAQTTKGEGHSGFHVAVGIGYGSVGLNCSECGGERVGNPAIMLRFGGAVRPGIVLSGELTGWSKSAEGATANVSWANFVAQFYPEQSRRLYLKTGIGVGRIDANIALPEPFAEKAEATSLGLEAGFGYDVRITRGFSLTPFADLLYSTNADVKLNGSSSGLSLGATLLHFGLAASWR